jgi:hypothetical protein
MRKILPALLIAAVLLLEVAFVYQYVVPREHYIFDFLQRWLGARALLLERRNPYSQEVTGEIQMALLGKPLAPDQCSQGFLYPPSLALTIPHFLLPYRLGLSAWIVTLQVLLVAAVWLAVHCTGAGSKTRSIHILLLTLAAATFRYSLLNLGYAQFSILILFWVVVVWWLWDKEQFVLAGIALTQVASKPQLALLLIPMWLVLALARRRWRFLVGFGAAMILLFALPFLFVGNWLPDFLKGLIEAINACQIPVYRGSGTLLRVGISLALAGGLLAGILRSPQHRQGRQLGYLLSVGIAVTLLGTPFIHSYDLVLGLLPLLYGLVTLRGLPGWPARLLELAFWATLVILPWLLWALAPKHQPDLLERWLFPTAVLVLLAGLAVIQKNQSTDGNLRVQP